MHVYSNGERVEFYIGQSRTTHTEKMGYHIGYGVRAGGIVYPNVRLHAISKLYIGFTK